MRLPSLTLLVLLGVAALMGACGDEEQLGSDEDVQRYFDQLDGAFDSLAASDISPAEIEQAISGIESADSLEEGVSALAALLELVRPELMEFRNQLDLIDPPPLVEDVHRGLIDLADEAISAGVELSERATEGDEPQRLLSDMLQYALEIDESSVTFCLQLRAAAQEHGLDTTRFRCE